MKKIVFIFLACACFAFAKSYSDEVVSLYLKKNDTNAAGRLLPTNSFDIIKAEDDKVLIRISGFINPKAPSVLYFNDHQRIMVAAFSKNVTLDFKNKIKGKNGKWDKVSIEVWAQKANFSQSDKDMLIKAKTLYMENCGICHAVHKESEFSANAWPATFRSMADRTAIEKKDRWLVIEYLQKNAKDFKKGK